MRFRFGFRLSWRTIWSVLQMSDPPCYLMLSNPTRELILEMAPKVLVSQAELGGIISQKCSVLSHIQSLHELVIDFHPLAPFSPDDAYLLYDGQSKHPMPPRVGGTSRKIKIGNAPMDHVDDSLFLIENPPYSTGAWMLRTDIFRVWADVA